MMRSLPLLNLVVLLTLMLGVEVRRRSQLCSRFQLMQEGGHICIAHEANAQGVNAMINVLQ
jgi:hypothetical protein